jgi:hypothetical protein
MLCGKLARSLDLRQFLQARWFSRIAEIHMAQLKES